MPSGQAPLPAPYREHSPPPALQPHFQCLWSSTVAPDYAGGFLVVPDGCVDIVCKGGQLLAVGPDRVDRKSTRLNSSHQIISYAVFCLKKKSCIHGAARCVSLD